VYSRSLLLVVLWMTFRRNVCVGATLQPHGPQNEQGQKQTEQEEKQQQKNVILYTYHPRHYEPFGKSLKSLDDHYNCKYKVPVLVFVDHLSKTDFNNVQALIKSTTCSKVELVNVDAEFSVPANVNLTLMQNHIDHVLGMGVAYRNMCRFWSGLVYLHPSVAAFDYYWRLDADSYILSAIESDPFETMARQRYIYGARVVIGESAKAVRGLKQAVDTFFGSIPTRSRSLVDSMAMYYTNFEIADLRWFRSDAYQRFFRYLDQLAGFHQERWGDAPVHSYAVDIMLEPGQVHFFEDIAYRHGAMTFDVNDPWKLWGSSCPLRHKNVRCAAKRDL